MSDIVKRVWEVPVCRVGYGHRKLRVEAPGESRVVELALDVAGDFEFSENTSKYTAPDGAHQISGPPPIKNTTAAMAAAYIKSPARCLHCNSENLKITSSDSDSNYIDQNILCGSCGSSWKDCYTLSHVSDILIPETNTQD